MVRTAATFAEAVEALNENSFDLLMTDIGLPDGSGWDLGEEAEARAAFAVAMSGYGAKADKDRSRNAGFRLHLVKPFSLRELLARIRSVPITIRS